MNSNIPSKVLKIPDCFNDIQLVPVEINLKKQKWLFITTSAPPSQCNNYFIIELTKILDKCRGFYENTVILGDFNMQPTNQILETFLIGIWSWRKQFKTHTKLSSPKTASILFNAFINHLFLFIEDRYL